MTWMAGQSVLSASFQTVPNVCVDEAGNTLEGRAAIERCN